MQKFQDYDDLTTYRKRSVLPPELQTAIVELTRELNAGGGARNALSDYVREIEQLPASSIAQAADEIADIGKLYRRAERTGASRVVASLLSYPSLKTDLDALSKYPELCHLYMFHRDGRLRQAALERLEDAPDSPFMFAALVYRLNDWVSEVRAAARDCATRLFPAASAAVVAEASLFLLGRSFLLQRWGPEERAVFDATLYRGDVMEALADLLIVRRTGPLAQALRLALSRPGLDPMLLRLVKEAAQPLVRAICLETLLNRSACWPVGYTHEWVDKSRGIKRRVCVFEERPVDHRLDLERLMVQGAHDRAAVVRRVAVSAMIRLRHDLSPAMIGTARELSRDKSQAVRSRAEFYLDNLP